MKMLNLFSFFSLLLLMASCGEKETETVGTENAMVTEQEVQDPDEAIENWTNAWNSNDTTQIRTQTAEDAVVVIDGNELPKDSIAGFIQGAGSIMKDLQMKSLKKGSTNEMAYDTGTYTHTYTTDTTQQYQGSYTFIWERSNDNNEWKVKAINISNVHPER